jgi:hypothetical protein
MQERAFLVIAACLVAALPGCGATSRTEDVRNAVAEPAAASQFERDEYCPLSRVWSRRIVPMPRPPLDIEEEADRLALWQREWRLRAETDPRMLVEVQGCGHRTIYSCWEVRVPDTTVNVAGRGRQGSIVLGATCLASTSDNRPQ